MTDIANDLILSELENLAKSFGEWSQSLVLGGGVALIVYDRCMAKSFSRPVGTTDMDFLIPRHPIISAAVEPLSKILQNQGFQLRTKDFGHPPIESYVKEMGETEVEVEFLTDDRARKKTDSVPIAVAQVVAQPLSYLEMSLESVTTAVLPGGTVIRVVRPEAWVFHKGITFPRRSAVLKRAKDLYGVWFVFTLLGEFSEAAWAALGDLKDRHPLSWKNTFSANLDSWVTKASPRDWDLLLGQDPERRMTEASFRGLVERLMGALA